RRVTASRSCSTTFAPLERSPISNSPRRSWHMPSRHGLGRGLGALLAATPELGGSITIEIPISSISPNPNQPRKDFNDNHLRDLADSLRNSGVLQPVVVRRLGEGYQLIVGERRWRAAKLAGLERVPAVVRDATDAEALELALVENLLREDLNPLEEAEAYHRLMAEFSLTQDELAGRIGKDRSSIANALRLRRLPDPIQADLRAGRLTMGHAGALLGLRARAAQLGLRDRILSLEWSVRATEADVRRNRRRRPLGRRRPAEVDALEEELRLALGLRVQLIGGLTRGRV